MGLKSWPRDRHFSAKNVGTFRPFAAAMLVTLGHDLHQAVAFCNTTEDAVPKAKQAAADGGRTASPHRSL